MKAIFGITVLTAALYGQDVAGDWQGTLNTGGPELRLILHIKKASDGALTATLDSVNQGANGIQLGTVTLTNRRMQLSSDAIHASYDGKVNADATVIDGTWSQGGHELPLVLKRAVAPKSAPPSDIDGTWMGTLDVGGTKLRVVFHIVNTQDGLTATTDSPDQGGFGIPVTKVTRTGPALKLEIESIGAVYEGKISPDRTTIDGTLTQGGGTIPLVLKPVKDVAAATAPVERRRPQNPVKPYPYLEEDVKYKNESAGIVLGATLTIPSGPGPFPAVVLITGSGQQDRDESLLGHKPFLVLADFLTRHGIAVLRADDRGAGKSGGNFSTSTTADFATDTEAGIVFLKTQSKINPQKLGLIGHSEGGMIAPMIAARNKDVAFIVMMAGPGVRGDELLPAQIAAIMEASGESHDEAMKHAQNEREVLALIEQGGGEDAIWKKMQELDSKVPEAQRKAQIRQLDSPWFKYFLTYDPAADLRKVKCPVLAINGEKDRQVPPDLNLPAIRKALEAGGNTHFELDKLTSLNHLFQTAKTGSPTEYAEIEETIAPLALNRMSDWILKQ